VDRLLHQLTCVPAVGHDCHSEACSLHSEDYSPSGSSSRRSPGPWVLWCRRPTPRAPAPRNGGLPGLLDLWSSPASGQAAAGYGSGRAATRRRS
jgi:hypothetical protein